MAQRELPLASVVPLPAGSSNNTTPALSLARTPEILRSCGTRCSELACFTAERDCHLLLSVLWIWHCGILSERVRISLSLFLILYPHQHICSPTRTSVRTYWRSYKASHVSRPQVRRYPILSHRSPSTCRERTWILGRKGELLYALLCSCRNLLLFTPRYRSHILPVTVRRD